MKRGHDLTGLMKFATRPEWADDLNDALDDHLGPALTEFDIDSDELPGIIGDHWAMTLWGCAFEDLATRVFEPDGRNLVDEYLKRRGWNETGPNKIYMRALKASVMSVYEVSAIEPGVGFLARDLIRGGEPVQVRERTASKTLGQWDRIGARIVPAGGHMILAGGLLSFTAEATSALLEALRMGQGKRAARTKLMIGDDQLRDLAPLISMVWLFDILPRMLEPATIPTLHNADGEEVVFHRVRFPFARGTTQALVAERLDTVPALQRETAHFWNWLGTKPTPGKKGTGRMAWGVTMEDGTPVLGNLELKGRALNLSVTSAERAERGVALITQTLGDMVGAPLTEIETVEQAMAARQEGRTSSEPAPDIPVEVATPLVHGMLDRQYRTLLNESVPMLGDKTPRQCARSKAGRDQLAVWLKHLENLSGRQLDPDDPMATYDFAWMWQELGIEELRR